MSSGLGREIDNMILQTGLEVSSNSRNKEKQCREQHEQDRQAAKNSIWSNGVMLDTEESCSSMIISTNDSSLEIEPGSYSIGRGCEEDMIGKRQLTIDALYAMMEQDNTHSCRDYLNDGNYISEDEMSTTSDVHVSNKLTAENRAQIVDWCYSLIDICQLARSNVAMAMSLADRFMTNPNGLHISQFTPSSFSPQEIRYDRIMFQLLAVTALYITIKINEQVPFSAEMFEAATRGVYTAKEIEAMERTILECLAWKVSAPTALEVGYTVLDLMTPQVQDICDMNNELIGSIMEGLAFQTESAVRDYYLVTTERTSTIAIMTLLNAIKYNENMSRAAQRHFLNAMSNVLDECKTRSLVVQSLARDGRFGW
jgi:hypothetical protein